MLFWHLLCVAWSPWTAVASNNLLSNYDLPVSAQLNYSDEPARFKRVCLSTLSSRGIKLGAGELGIGSSGIEGAKDGLFSRVEWEENARICPCLGPRVSNGNDAMYGGVYVVEAVGNGWRRCLDMGEEKSCFARYANDRIDDDTDNARPEMQRDGTMWLVAKSKIMPGDEITYAYGRAYWVAHWRVLSESARIGMMKFHKVNQNELVYPKKVAVSSKK
jgi:hypothetical protein